MPNDYSKFTRQQLIERIYELESLHLPSPDQTYLLRRAFELRPRQAQILHLLLQNAGKVCYHEYLEELIVPDETERNRRNDGERNQVKNAIHAHICHIRNRLRPHTITIETIWFKGFTISKENAQKVYNKIAIFKAAYKSL